MAKRIQMRKNRFLALQKMAEQKKNEAMNANNAAMNDGGPPDHHGMPKQTVSQSKILDKLIQNLYSYQMYARLLNGALNDYTNSLQFCPPMFTTFMIS